MIRYLLGKDFPRHADLVASMFRDRTAQFRDRHEWEVNINAIGWETDQYDRSDTFYVIATDGDGMHAGSLRFLPTVGPHMLADIFSHLAPPIRDETVWEATRFCLSPGSGTEVTRTLLLAASQFGRGLGLSRAVGVYSSSMGRVYRRLGWEPATLGNSNGITAGIWQFSGETQLKLVQSLGLHPRTPVRWFEQDLGDLQVKLGSREEFREAG